MDFFFARNFTPNRGHAHQDFCSEQWTSCVCVYEFLLYNHGQSPYPCVGPWLELFFTRIPMGWATSWWLPDNRGRPWLVCVHGYTVIFLMNVHC